MRMFQRFKPMKVAVYKALGDMRIEEWADNMGAGGNVIRVRRGQNIGVYQYRNGAFSHLQLGSNKIGKYGLFTPLNSILSNCILVK